VMVAATGAAGPVVLACCVGRPQLVQKLTPERVGVPHPVQKACDGMRCPCVAPGGVCGLCLIVAGGAEDDEEDVEADAEGDHAIAEDEP